MTLVYKFGGASVKDAKSVKGVRQILENEKNNMVVVVSAMGKTTRALEALIDDYIKRKDVDEQLTDIIKFHHNVIKELFETDADSVINEFNRIVVSLFALFDREKAEFEDFYYDQVIAYGELFSSFIVAEYLKYTGLKYKLVDIRKVIKTDKSYRNAQVDWEVSTEIAQETFTFSDTDLYITQGFIASDKENNTTSLGLEGSDFTAAILSHVLNVERMVVWKDVDGIYSSDPRKFDDVIKLDALSYNEAVELAYFGAKVIHPKTIKPLQNKDIPLYVKSFVNPDADGTLITKTTENKLGVEPHTPIFITKENQTLVSISPRDFSFISESALGYIFAVLSKYDVAVNLMQNSAISFSICVDFKSTKIIRAIKELREKYKVRYNSGLTLVTIRHYNDEVINRTTKDKKIFVQQKSRHTARFVVS